MRYQLNVKKILGFSIGPLGSAFLGFLTLPLTAWFFNSEDIGRIALLQIVLGLTTMLFSLGLDQAYVREYHERNNKNKLWIQVVLPGSIFLTIFCIFFLLQKYLLADLIYQIKSNTISILILISIITNFYIRFFSLILRMEEKGWIYSIIQILPKLLNIILILGFVLLFINKNFTFLIFAQTLSSVLTFIFLAWYTRKNWLNFFNINLDVREILPLIKFGTPLIIGGLAYWGLSSIDRLFVAKYSSLKELGIYSIAMSFAGVALIIQNIFSVIWAPTVYKWVKNNENLEKINEISWYLTIIITFFISAMGLFSFLIDFLLPSNYLEVKYIIMPALIAPLLYTLSETTVVGIGISRKTHYSLFASLGAFLCSLVLNYNLVPQLGALGASISSSIAFFIFFILRTELSVYAWKSFPRMKIYCIIFILIFISDMNAILQDKYNFIFKLVWFIIFFISIFGILKMYKSYNKRLIGD